MLRVYQEIVELCGTMEVTVLMDRNNYCFRHSPVAVSTLLCVAAEYQATRPAVVDSCGCGQLVKRVSVPS